MQMTDVVLIPARNEAPRVGALVRAVGQAVPAAAIWVVDGHSTDETAAEASRAGARVLLQEGQGYAAGLATGYRAALAHGFRRLVQLDADGQHPPDALPLLLGALDDADVAVGSRAGTRSPGGWGRRLGNHALALAVSGAATACRVGEPAPRDVTSGLQAYRPDALARMAPHFPCRVADANLRVLWLRLGFRVREVPVFMSDRQAGTSMHDGLAGVRNLGHSVLAVWQAATRSL